MLLTCLSRYVFLEVLCLCETHSLLDLDLEVSAASAPCLWKHRRREKRVVVSWKEHSSRGHAFQVIVGTTTSDMFHVFELKTVVTKNAMFAEEDASELGQPPGSVTFSLTAPPIGVLLWLQETYHYTGDVNAEGGVLAGFVHLRDGLPFIIAAGAACLPALRTAMSSGAPCLPAEH